MSTDFDSAEKAVLFLRDSAKRYGNARGHAAFCSGNLRRVKAIQMLDNPTGSLGEREAKAYASEAYLSALNEEEKAIVEYTILQAQREACVYRIELFRTSASAKKQGIDL